MEAALKSAFWGIFANKGEICSAASRLLVHEDIHDRFVGELVARARKLRVGDPLDKGTQMGSQVSGRQMERILDYIQSGKDEGAKLGMRRRARCRRREGQKWFFREADDILRGESGI